jgi:outer membrane protein assembly factor BamB
MITRNHIQHFCQIIYRRFQPGRINRMKYLLFILICLPLLSSCAFSLPLKTEAPLTYITDFGRRDAEGQLNLPSAIYVTPQDEIVVADTVNERLEWFSLDGNYIKELKISFPAIYGFTPSNDKNWFIVNGWGQNVYKISIDGQLLDTYSGWPKPKSKQIHGIQYIAQVADGTIYLAEFRGNRVIILNYDGSLREVWTGPENQPFEDIFDITTDQFDNLYVVSYRQNLIIKRTPQGYINTFEFNTPRSITTCGNNFYVGGENTIQYRNSNGEVIRRWNLDGDTTIEDLATTSNCSLVVLRTGIASIDEEDMLLLHYNQQGILLNKFGYTALQPGQFETLSAFSASPLGDVWFINSGNPFLFEPVKFELVHLDRDGNYLNSYQSLLGYDLNSEKYELAALSDQSVFLTIPDEGRILQVNENGNLVIQWKLNFISDKQFNRISDISIAPDEKSIYVVDAGDSCISQWDLNGILQNKWFTDEYGIHTPIGLAIDLAGVFYVIDGTTHRIYAFTSKGILDKWKLPFSAENPYTIAIDLHRNRLFIGDRGYNLYAYETNGKYLGKRTISDSYGTMVSVDGVGRVYMSQGFHRIAIFEPFE